MIHATLTRRAYNDLEDIFVHVGKCDPSSTRSILEEVLWERCCVLMGLDWTRSHGTASEAAAEVIALKMLKQIEIVEDRT